MILSQEAKELVRTPPDSDRALLSDEDLEALKERAETLLKLYREAVESKSEFAALQEQSLVTMLMRGMDLV
jgi:hypothetical protein